MDINIKLLSRRCHRWISVAIAVPLLIVLSTGILLLLKKQIHWVQPPTQLGSRNPPSLTFDRVLERAKSVTKAQIRSWSDIDRLDVRPEKGIIKVRGKNRWEIQLDSTTGDILQVAYRRSDLIESIHDGSWFHENAKLAVFLSTALLFLFLWFTGIYLFWLPFQVKLARKRRLRQSGTR